MPGALNPAASCWALALALAAASASAPAAAQVIFEDEGLHADESWNIEPFYDELDDPTDEPGIVTGGEDPDDPAGPALDFETRPGSLGLDDDEGSDADDRI